MSGATSAHITDCYDVCLIPPGEKGPKERGWPDKRVTPEEYDRHVSRGGNVGIILGRASGIIDIEGDGAGAEESRRKLFGGEPPETPAWAAFRGEHDLYAWDERFAGLGAKFTCTAEYPGLEFRLGAEAAQSVCPPSIVDGVRRTWIREGEPAKLPDAVVDKIVAAYAIRDGAKPKPVINDSPFANLQQQTLADILRWADRFGVSLSDKQTTNDLGAIVLHFGCCPLRGHDDGGATLFVNADGSVIFFCHHDKCSGRSFKDLEVKYGPYHRQRITVNADLHKLAAKALNGLRRDESIFNRGGILVQLERDPPPPKLCLSDNGAPRLSPIPAPVLALRLAEHCRWEVEVYTADGIKIKHVEPHKKVVAGIAASSHLPGIPTITGIVSCPVLRPDGSIANKRGYDKQTGLCLDIDDDWPAPMSVDEAVHRLTDIFCDFPFAEPAHKSAAIAGPVTMVSRHAFAGPSPCLALEGNAPRIGKGLLSDLFAEIAEGRKASRMSFSEDDAEMRKCITSCALAGISYVLFDNIKGKFGGKSLEGAITAGRWSDRLLGTNRTIDLPFSPVWLMTANNCSISPDMVGRMLMCKLHTDEESPGARTNFKHPDLLNYVKQHRRELAMAALSIPFRYMQAGMPEQPINAWGGFDGWNNLVRASLVWAGLPDPDTRAQVAEESDEESSILRQLLDAWPKGAWSVANIVKALQTGNYSDNDPYPALREIVAELPGADKARALGQILRDSRGRVLNGKRFVRSGGQSCRKWAVEAI